MFRNSAAILLVTAGVFSLAGCVLPDQLTKLQKDVSALQVELQRLESEQQASTKKLDEIVAQVSNGRDDVSRSEFADLKLRLDEINRQGTVLDERLIEVNRRIDRLSQGVQENRELIRQTASTSTLLPPAAVDRDPGTGGGAPPSAGRPGAIPSAEDLYNSAYGDFSKANYALAISGFEEYADRYPDSDLADNALYWIGECYFSQGNHGVALEAFDRMLSRYPESDRAAAANLKKGLAYSERNQIREAIVQLRFVQETYPATDEARVARDKLASLGVQRP